jgi:hypothetical protein
MQDIKEQIIIFIGKWWTYPIYIILGLIGKFGHDISRGDKIPFWKIMSSICVAATIGFLASVWCSIHAEHLAPIIVPIATLLSDKIMTAVMSLKVETIREFIIQNLTKKK